MQITLIILGTLLLIGVLYEQYARYKAKKNYPIKGAFVDVGEHALHYVKKGSGDTATIIFESALDFGGHIEWKNIQDKLSQNFTTLSYDRAGILHSQRGTHPKDCSSIAKDLHLMLEQLNLPKPYIFVGHSIAGVTLRCFMDQHPQHVAGMVLLDPSEPEFFEKLPKKTQKMSAISPPKWLLSLLLSIGLIRVIFTKMTDKYATDVQVSEKENYKEALAYIHKSFTTGYADEFLNLTALFNETKRMEFDSIPIVLLGATKTQVDKKSYHEILDIFTTLHHKTVNKSLKGEYIAVDGTHYFPLEKPELVVETVERFAKEVLD